MGSRIMRFKQGDRVNTPNGKGKVLKTPLLPAHPPHERERIVLVEHDADVPNHGYRPDELTKARKKK